MPLQYILEALGGLGLFILGMKTMSEGLQKLAGDRFRRLLERVAGNRLTAALLGTTLSSLLQSSSAAGIITISFVNAGLVSLYQALGILLGTGIGTTLAVQFIAFKITSLALPAIFLGVALKYFGRRRRWVNAGELLLGAGLLFLGLRVMESNLLPLQQSSVIFNSDTYFISKRLTAVLLGAFLTFLVQSSSAAIGIVMALVGSGLVSFDSGAAMVIGEVLGTSCITAIASIGGTLEAKRTVLFYFLINLFAVSAVMLFFPSYLKLVETISPADIASPSAVSRVLANAHTLFNTLNACIFLPLIGFFARSAPAILPGREQSTSVERRSVFIDSRVLNTPPIAIMQARNELRRMGEITRAMYSELVEQFFRFDARRSTGIAQKEATIDILQRDISDFLVSLSRRTLSTKDTLGIPVMLQTVSDLEHIGDQSEAILSYLRRKKEEKLLFSGTAMSDIRSLARKVEDFVRLATESLDSLTDMPLTDSRELHDEIVAMGETMQNAHIQRLASGKCNVRAGIIYSDMIMAFTKIADSCYNIIETTKEFA
ncbi:sodium:phosphate symporter [Geotalea uraniireducens]|uniref:Sodium:phosphate symporter n=1 Tax=Geotalea uraniireducens TaxID=351604 RepID=A0ABM8ELE4_9BACT|nr:Na/Pi cotransporter family protein [Geotalea uraniireducens]BDV43243.1 sodium:phosphate symporter [Geotalea uraniireducens]